MFPCTLLINNALEQRESSAELSWEATHRQTLGQELLQHPDMRRLEEIENNERITATS